MEFYIRGSNPAAIGIFKREDPKQMACRLEDGMNR